MNYDIVDLLRALDHEEMTSSFQPIVELSTGRLTGFEVLARWRQPDHGLVLPTNFIALAEEHDLIGRLMQQVFRSAFLYASDLPDPLTLAVNISPLQLRDLDLPAKILATAKDTGFPMNRLTIEITESALVDNLYRARAIVYELKGMGCRLALDDFGTGYSSLSHLQTLPFDELKIDRSFVASMTMARESRKIVAAIVGLGHSLGLMTVAEGIETEEQADMLLWLGCGRGQGWLYGKPSPGVMLPAMAAAPSRILKPRVISPGDGWAVSSLEALPSQRLAQLQAIYDGAPVGLCFLDRNLRYVSINRRLAEMNGSTVAAHIGKTVVEMIPESYPIVAPYMLRALAGEPISEVEVLRPPSIPGGRFWYAMLSYQPAFDEADEVIGISVAVVDTTLHNQMKNSLRESDDRQDSQVEQNNEWEQNNNAEQSDQVELHDQVPWIMDAEGDSLYVSARWVQTSSFGRQRTRNLGWLEPLHADDLEKTMKVMKEALHTGKPIDIEYRIKDIEGKWRWMRSRGSPRFGAAGEIVRWYGSVEDIDGRKQDHDPIVSPLDR